MSPKTSWIAGALLALYACAEQPPQPNVLLVSLDTTRADRLGCYGYGRATSPRLDALAAGGVLFELAIAQAAVTPVSHASILTGLNPYHHGLRVMHGEYENRLAEQHWTLAEILSEAGWSTGGFVSALPASEHFGLHQGYTTFDAEFAEPAEPRLDMESGVVNTGGNQRRADGTTERALAWLDQAERPFHLFVHWFDPHDAQVLPPPEVLERHAPLPDRPRPKLRRLYDIELEYMDTQLGRILDALEERGELENTLIVVVGDHGEGLGDHDWWSHGILYQEQIRVPLVLAGPGVPAGETCSAVVRTVDILPTLLDLCGLEVEGAIDGLNLLAALRGEPAPGRVAYSDSINLMTYAAGPGFLDEKTDMLFAVVRGRWKYIHHLGNPESSELYDLGDDPHETRNRLADEPALAAELRALALARGSVPEKQLEPSGMPQELIERLESMGYIGEDE